MLNQRGIAGPLLGLSLLSTVMVQLVAPVVGVGHVATAEAAQTFRVSMPQESGEPHGTVFGWTSTLGNAYGVLGDGTELDSVLPSQAVGLDGVTAVAAGRWHSLALREDGTVWAWGDNQDNSLIAGLDTRILTPAVVGGLDGVTAISAGYRYNLALKGDGSLWSWGVNDRGQLGSGSVADAVNTSPTPAPIGGLIGVVSASAGLDHSLAATSDGLVWAWGNNWAGQLGNGTLADSATPMQVSGLSGIVAVSAGDSFSVALASDGTVWSWGYNDPGLLGNGTTDDSVLPTRVVGVSGVTAIRAGAGHSLALTADGTVWSWGYNGWGALGNGMVSTDANPIPLPVAGVGGVTSIAAGWGNSAAVAADGNVYEWGYERSTTPAQVGGIYGVTAVAAGASHILALRS